MCAFFFAAVRRLPDRPIDAKGLRLGHQTLARSRDRVADRVADRVENGGGFRERAARRSRSDKSLERPGSRRSRRNKLESA